MLRPIVDLTVYNLYRQKTSGNLIFSISVMATPDSSLQFWQSGRLKSELFWQHLTPFCFIFFPRLISYQHDIKTIKIHYHCLKTHKYSYLKTSNVSSNADTFNTLNLEHLVVFKQYLITYSITINIHDSSNILYLGMHMFIS